MQSNFICHLGHFKSRIKAQANTLYTLAHLKNDEASFLEHKIAIKMQHSYLSFYTNNSIDFVWNIFELLVQKFKHVWIVCDFSFSFINLQIFTGIFYGFHLVAGYEQRTRYLRKRNKELAVDLWTSIHWTVWLPTWKQKIRKSREKYK